MNGYIPARVVHFVAAFTMIAGPVFAQFELTGSYAPRLYEDYIERGPREAN